MTLDDVCCFNNFFFRLKPSNNERGRSSRSGGVLIDTRFCLKKKLFFFVKKTSIAISGIFGEFGGWFLWNNERVG